jgi:hypothetical protein
VNGLRGAVLVVTNDEPVVMKPVRNFPAAEATEVLSTEQVLRAASAGPHREGVRRPERGVTMVEARRSSSDHQREEL